jgi:hypothetical protein
VEGSNGEIINRTSYLLSYSFGVILPSKDIIQHFVPEMPKWTTISKPKELQPNSDTWNQEISDKVSKASYTWNQEFFCCIQQQKNIQ